MAATTLASDELPTFNPPWIKDIIPTFLPFPIRHINTKSTKLQDLKHSILTTGYNDKEPIVVARSKDPLANGYVMDGRNRLTACDMIFRESGSKMESLPAITVRYEQVPDLAHAKLRQIAYESKWLLGKTPEDAADHIITLYEEVKQEKPEIFQDEALDKFFQTEAKISDVPMLNALVARIERHEEKERKRHEKEQSTEDNKVKPTRRHAKGGEQRTMEEAGGKKVNFKSYTSEVEYVCVHGKRQTIPLNVNVYEDGRVTTEAVT